MSHSSTEARIIAADRAQFGEQCDSCGYPFDTGHRVYVVDDSLVYCSMPCLRHHFLAHESKVFHGKNYSITLSRGQFHLIPDSSESEVYDSFSELIEDHPACRDAESFFFGA